MPIGYCSKCSRIWSGNRCPVHGDPLETVGRLTISGGTPFLDDVPLARRGPDPFGEAIAFLNLAGFREGDLIQVTGMEGTLNGVRVIFIESVRASMLEGAS